MRPLVENRFWPISKLRHFTRWSFIIITKSASNLYANAAFTLRIYRGWHRRVNTTPTRAFGVTSEILVPTQFPTIIPAILIPVTV